jgi:hypothetical protein
MRIDARIRTGLHGVLKTTSSLSNHFASTII